MKKSISIILVAMLILSTGILFAGCGIESNIDNGGDADLGDVTSLGENPTDAEINAFITQESSNPDKLILRYASTSADLDGQSYLRGCREFLKVLKEDLGDAIEIQYYLNGTFGGSADAVIGGLQNGNFELTDWPLASFAEYTDAFKPLDVPYLLGGLDETVEFCQGDAGELMREKCINDTDINPLFYGIIGMRQITNSKREITTPADLNGLKVRVQNNELHIAGMGALGCAPSTMPFSELFTALQQKTVDGQENPIETIYNFGYYEIQNYMTLTDHLGAVGAICINNDFYETLDNDMKAVFDKAGKAATEYIVEDIQGSTDELLEELRELMNVTELSAEQIDVFREQARTAWPKMKELIGPDYFTSILEAGGIEE